MSEVINNEEKSKLKSFKDVNSVEELDFNKIELIRGETPHDINEKCLKLCKDYLSGNWSQQTVDTIEVRRITGGINSQLYYCGIKEPDTNESVPQEVAIKLYGRNILESFDGGSRIRDVVMALMMSEHKLGPQIYGLFEDGQIQKFYKHRQFKEEEQKSPDLRNKVFRSLAQIHSLKVPIKNQNWRSGMLRRCYKEALENFPIEKEMDDFNCHTLKKCDLKTEIEWILDLVDNLGSPVVLTHNDYRSSNIMITEPNDQIVVCDYDVMSYGYRGFDFVSLSHEWGRNQFDFTQVNGLKFKDEEFKPLIEIYVEECVRIHGKSYSENEINSVDNILREVKILNIFYSIFCAVYFMNNDEAKNGFPFNRKVGMGMVEKMIEEYFAIKEQLKQQNII